MTCPRMRLLQVHRLNLKIFQKNCEMSTQVMEGFLCPICMEDLGTVSQLQEHFEKDHNEDRDLVDSFKGKILSCIK